MSDETVRMCPECAEPMASIVLIDKQHMGVAGQLQYRLPDDRPSFWTGRYPTAGPVTAMMCGKCGRIVMYGSPDEPE